MVVGESVHAQVAIGASSVRAEPVGGRGAAVTSSSLGEWLGRRVGAALAPAAALASFARAARALHADGVVYRADVEPLAPEGEALRALAARLTGVAIVRFSSAVWRGRREWPDLLGCAVRFRGDGAVTEVPADTDQDVLFATARGVATALLAPLATNPHDYLGNGYHAMLPFDVPGVGRAWLRLTTPRVALVGRDRATRLEYAVAQGAGALRLELRAERGPGRGRWRPVAMVRLRTRVELDQRALAFSPFRTGRELVPRGFVQAVRAAVYNASQHGRPRR